MANAVFGHLMFEFFIDQPFVRGVLVDDHHTVTGLGNDVVFMHLTTRGAQRQILYWVRFWLYCSFFDQTATVGARHLGKPGRFRRWQQDRTVRAAGRGLAPRKNCCVRPRMADPSDRPSVHLSQ